MAKKVQTGGRPREEIDFELLDRLLNVHCSLQECASVLGCSTDVLQMRVRSYAGKSFTAYKKEKEGVGKANLRKQMFDNAVNNNNTTMQIWLSKQYLDMKDTKAIEHDAADGLKKTFADIIRELPEE